MINIIVFHSTGLLFRQKSAASCSSMTSSSKHHPLVCQMMTQEQRGVGGENVSKSDYVILVRSLTELKCSKRSIASSKKASHYQERITFISFPHWFMIKMWMINDDIQLGPVKLKSPHLKDQAGTIQLYHFRVPQRLVSEEKLLGLKHWVWLSSGF